MNSPSNHSASTRGPVRLLSLLGVILLALVAFFLFRPSSTEDKPAEPPPADFMKPATPVISAAEFPAVTFKEVSAELGIDFVHDNGASGKLMMPEPAGSGGGFFDYDNDGDQDMLLLSCCKIVDHRDPPAEGQSIVLYENDGQGNFTNVSKGSGLQISCYAMGLAIADYDNDGWRDIFVTAVGRNRLFRGIGRGKFEEVTESAGVGGRADQWSSSAGFFDSDNDGDLDLFVCNYVHWTAEKELAVQQEVKQPESYMAPRFFPGDHCLFYENNGDGTFSDISESSGMMIRDEESAELIAKAFGVIFVDLDRDGWLDIVVANDQTRSFLLRNNGDQTFEDVGVKTAFGYDSLGQIVAGMGIDFCQVEGQTGMLVAIANLAKFQTVMYFTQNDRFSFVDNALRSGIVPGSARVTTFGLVFLDYDLDGHLDIVQANGHINSEAGSTVEGIDYLQPTQLFWYYGGSGTLYQPVPTEKCGTEIYEPILGRAAAYADIDADGDLDVLVTANHDRIRLFRNENQLGHNWLRVQLQAKGVNRDAIGAEVLLEMDEGSQRRWVMPTRSYLSQVELPVTFGLGKERQPIKLTIRWPDGTMQEVNDLPVNQLLLVEQPAIGPDDDVK